MHPWLTSASARLAQATGASHEDVGLDDADVAALLDLARIAAHESGERTNAPLLCFLVGVVHGRSGRPLDELAAAATAPPPEGAAGPRAARGRAPRRGRARPGR
jgi:hypothetical protein